MSNDKASHQVFTSNELSKADLTQTTYLHLTERYRERESVMMTKPGGFHLLQFLGSHENRLK